MICQSTSVLPSITSFMNRTVMLVSMIAILTGALGQPALAQQLSPAQAADSARNVTGGKVLKVHPPKPGSTDYRVKMLLPEGKVRNVVIDGNNGKVKQGNKALKK